MVLIESAGSFEPGVEGRVPGLGQKVTTLEAPTGTLIFYYKDIKQEIVPTLLLEECVVSKMCVIIMDRRQY